MAGKRGRPADGQHLRMARLLAALSSSERGFPRSRLQQSMGLIGADEDQERVFRRDLRHLRDLGWDIRTEKYAPGVSRYRLVRIDSRFRMVFSAEERLQLLRVARHAGLGGVYDDLDPDHDDEPWATDALAPPNLEVAQYAVAFRCRLHVRYHGERRTVHPSQVVRSQGRWLLQGWVEDRQQAEFFYLDEIREMRPEAPDTAAHTTSISSSSRHPMRWALDEPQEAMVNAAQIDVPDVIDLFGARSIVAVTTPDSAGVQTLTVWVSNQDAFFARLFELGSRVRLVGPSAIRDAARQRLRWALAKQS